MLEMIAGPVARILMRVIAGLLMGYFGHDAVNELIADPGFEALVTLGVNVTLGAILWFGTEIYYWAAKKLGLKT